MPSISIGLSLRGQLNNSVFRGSFPAAAIFDRANSVILDRSNSIIEQRAA